MSNAAWAQEVSGQGVGASPDYMLSFTEANLPPTTSLLTKAN